MKILKKQLNSPWIKDIDAIEVRGLDAGVLVACPCSCDDSCSQFCICPDPPFDDHFSDWWDNSNRRHNSIYDMLDYC